MTESTLCTCESYISSYFMSIGCYTGVSGVKVTTSRFNSRADSESIWESMIQILPYKKLPFMGL